MATVEVEQVTPAPAENNEVTAPKTMEPEGALPVAESGPAPVTESETPVEVTTKDLILEETEETKTEEAPVETPAVEETKTEEAPVETPAVEETKTEEAPVEESPAVVEEESKTEEVVETKKEEEVEEKKTEETPVVVEEEKTAEAEKENPTEVAAAVETAAAPVEKADE